MKTLWDKGEGSLDAQVARFTVGEDRVLDVALARADVLGSMAHVVVLEQAGLLSGEDAEALLGALARSYEVACAGELVVGPGQEDIHSALEGRLTEELGEPGKRVHTARSRNDQVATDLALWMREQVVEMAVELASLVEAILSFGEARAGVNLVGMTHMQPAMPSTVGLWAGGWAALFLEDGGTVRGAYRRADACPLGSAAGYGVPGKLAPIDRRLSARLLGFGRVLEPVTAVQAGRGKAESALLFACAQIMETAAKLAQEMVLWMHPAFGFLRLPTQMTTGSSIMPQKRNPDVLELIRGRAAGVQGCLFEVMRLGASAPGGGYHRDYQLLKPPLMRGVASTREVLRMLSAVFARLEVNEEALERAMRPEVYATQRALELVVGGQPFREAYRVVAAEVEGAQIELEHGELPVDEGIKGELVRLSMRCDELEVWAQERARMQEQVVADLMALGAGQSLEALGIDWDVVEEERG